MSKLNRYLGLGTMVGLLAVTATPITPAFAATPAKVGVGAQAPGAQVRTELGVRVPDDPTSPWIHIPESGLGDLECFAFEYNLGPFGPFGPWGPAGPLHDENHPKCWGGGPDFD